MGQAGDPWQVLGDILGLAGAIACALTAGWVLLRGDRSRRDRLPVAAALAVSAVWCVLATAYGPRHAAVGTAEIGRNLAWVYAVYRLFANDGRDRTMRPIRWVVAMLALVECLQLPLLLVASQLAGEPHLARLTFQLSIMFRILVAIGALVLLHNLYSGASASVRATLQWTTGALTAMWAFDLNFHTVAYLSGSFPHDLAALRGLTMAAVALPLAIGAMQRAASIRLHPSRGVAFQSLSLLVIAAYMLTMIIVAQLLALLGDQFGRLAQVGFTFVAAIAAMFWLPSQRLRGWLRVTAIKHFFQHRYDYRAEWLRFTRTIGQASSANASLQERVIKAMADITDSPHGLLLLPGDGGTLELAARWAWPHIEVPAQPVPPDLVHAFETSRFILDVDAARAGVAPGDVVVALPEWLREQTDAWAMVPLLHFDRLTGAILLARPAEARELDWEDFDLLRIVGQQLASYLAEQAGQQALMESARFDEFNRRIAFVIHDIKNLASQMALLARNAEKHAENPAFRADMLVTLKASSDKLNALLARLGRYGANSAAERAEVDLAGLAQKVARRLASVHPVTVVNAVKAEVMADPEALEQALVHLVQNAIDASGPDSPVFLHVGSDGVRGRLEIVDAGCGMTAEFVRSSLFKPFVSSKPAGFGIGAFEAREMIRAMGGRLDVESREGIGSRFVVSLPLAAVSELMTGVALSRTPSERAA